MKQRMFSTFMMILYFLASSVHASNDQATDENLKNFTKDLDERMKEIKDFAKDKSNEAYRIVCSKKGMKKMSKFVNLSQSKKKSTDSDKEITIVKIMRYGNPENFDVEMLKKQFLCSAMEYLDYGKAYKPLGDTRITFEPILMSNLRDYDLINTKVVTKTTYLNQINNLVVNEQAEITKVVCKQIILEKIKKCLVYLVDDSMKAHYTAEKLSETIDKYRKEILGDTGLVNPKTFKYSTWLLRLISKDSIFNNIFDEAVKLGDKLIVKYSDNSKETINSFIVYLLTVTQKNALDFRLKSILSLALSDSADNGSKAAFETLVTDEHVKMLQEFESKTITKPTDTKWDYVENLAKEDGFKEKLEDFYSVIKFDDIYKTLESSDEFKTNTFLKFADDSTTTLIFGDQLDYKTFNTFYDKVNRSNILGKLDDYKHRLIFIESTTEKTWQGLVQGLGKNEKMMVKSFYASDSVLSYISKVKTDNEGSTSNPLQPYDGDHLAHETTEDKTGICDNTTMCDTTISITDFEGFEGNQNLVEFLSKLADSFNQKSEYDTKSKKMLTITTELGTSSVYLWSWQNKNTLRGKVSVLFNIYSKKGNCDDKGLSNRYIHCVDNFLQSDLIDLKHQLQAMLIKKCPIFEIPNTLSINNAVHAYKVTSLHMSSSIDTKREIIRKVVNDQSSNFAGYYIVKIPMEEILTFLRGKTLASESVKTFIKNAGITEDALHRIFEKLLPFKPVNDTAKPNILPAFEFKTVYDVRLVHVVFQDKSSVLHICDVKNLGYSKFIMENITKMLLNSYEFILESPIPENCNDFINSIIPKINIAALILTDLLDFYSYDFGCNKILAMNLRENYPTDLVDRITDRIYGLKKAQKKSKSNGKDANESLAIEEFKFLMEASIKEIAYDFMGIFETLSNGHSLKVTSILLSGREGENVELAKHYKDMEMLPLGDL